MAIIVWILCMNSSWYHTCEILQYFVTTFQFHVCILEWNHTRRKKYTGISNEVSYLEYKNWLYSVFSRVLKHDLYFRGCTRHIWLKAIYVSAYKIMKQQTGHFVGNRRRLNVVTLLHNFAQCQPRDRSKARWSSVYPDNKVYGHNMGPAWVLSAPDEPHVGPMNPVIWVNIRAGPMSVYSGRPKIIAKVDVGPITFAEANVGLTLASTSAWRRSGNRQQVNG